MPHLPCTCDESVGAVDQDCPAHGKCADCGGTAWHFPGCRRRDMMATWQEVDQAIGEIRARQMASDPEFVRQTEAGYQAIAAGRSVTLDELKQRLAQYDPAKVRAWLEALRPFPGVAWLVLSHLNPVNPPLDQAQQRVAEFHEMTPWEKVNVLYGLWDAVEQEFKTLLLDDYKQHARQRDEEPKP